MPRSCHRLNCLAVLVTTALAVLTSTACGVSVHGGTISGDGPYRAVWKESWEQIQRDELPYVATEASPGVCNAGGDKQACVDADRTLAADVVRLQKALETVHVPGPYAQATTVTLHALAQDLRGLNLRMLSLTAGDWTLVQRNEWFRQSNVELRAAQRSFAEGWAAFPDWARPSPPPQV